MAPWPHLSAKVHRWRRLIHGRRVSIQVVAERAQGILPVRVVEGGATSPRGPHTGESFVVEVEWSALSRAVPTGDKQQNYPVRLNIECDACELYLSSSEHAIRSLVIASICCTKSEHSIPILVAIVFMHFFWKNRTSRLKNPANLEKSRDYQLP